VWQRVLPIAVLAVGLGVFSYLGYWHYVFPPENALQTIRANRSLLLAYEHAHPVLAAALFALIYTGLVAFSIPGGTILTIAGGFLFGTLEASILGTCSATVGGTILFLATRTALADYFRARMGPRLRHFEDGFNKSAFSYVFASRLIPMFPFPIVNIASGLLGVKTRIFASATFLGIIPATVVFAGLGSGLGKLFDRGIKPDLYLLQRPQILIPLTGLAVLALIPPVWRAIAARRASGNSQ
jgi:uncharacterized membrane protein YdjX (TVP38/TMEM64 family)